MKLLARLRTIDNDFYDNSNTVGASTGDRYFLLDGHPKKNTTTDTEDVILNTIEHIDSVNNVAFDKMLPRVPDYKTGA